MDEKNIKNMSWVTRLALVGGWTAACAMIWFLWLGSMASSAEAQGMDETAVGLGACMVTGCVGSVWFGVLLVALVVYALVRR